MRRIQAGLAASREVERFDGVYERLADEEERLRLGPDDEFVQYGPEAKMAKAN